MRTRVTTDYYLRVEPNVLGQIYGRTEAEVVRDQADECRRILGEIKRHVDDCTVQIETETEDRCEFCGDRWTEGPDAKHNGGCCEQDEAVMLAEEGEE